LTLFSLKQSLHLLHRDFVERIIEVRLIFLSKINNQKPNLVADLRQFRARFWSAESRCPDAERIFQRSNLATVQCPVLCRCWELPGQFWRWWQPGHTFCGSLGTAHGIFAGTQPTCPATAISEPFLGCWSTVSGYIFWKRWLVWYYFLKRDKEKLWRLQNSL